ncbi:DUF4231 domain-containing protein [Mesorhizobium sp. KR2-14]|uniref:DUF4231 domain-containing protein n=1 Tax=Mesorhizobium sp. KR2-14 TaxID=3156610 RepID=UPI0032B57388
MQHDNFPALYRSADGSAVDAQRIYLWLIRLQYLLLTVAASISIWFGSSPDLYIGYAVVLAASTALLLYMAVQKPEKDWYGCRALAESIKTSTWRYMMRAEPFEDAPKLSAVAEKFSHFLKAILDANSHVRDSISRRPVVGDQISKKMNEIRALSLTDRIQKYVVDRIGDQREWYVSKVRWNRRRFRVWISICVVVQATAIGLALVRIRYDPTWMIWPTEPLLVIASSAIGWVQLKKFNELASAYSLTAHEIGILQTRIGAIDTEEKFSAFVNEAERAFSREHTQWVARQIENA